VVVFWPYSIAGHITTNQWNWNCHYMSQIWTQPYTALYSSIQCNGFADRQKCPISHAMTYVWPKVVCKPSTQRWKRISKIQNSQSMLWYIFHLSMFNWYMMQYVDRLLAD
jgi:hypothetical protein